MQRAQVNTRERKSGSVFKLTQRDKNMSLPSFHTLRQISLDLQTNFQPSQETLVR